MMDHDVTPKKQDDWQRFVLRQLTVGATVSVVTDLVFGKFQTSAAQSAPQASILHAVLA
jgi:hypothetical protein